ncbi:MAG: hypothetical protein A3H34_01905 [Betaproteobacteria bacterium RIFCSPLOWO2_02_FULL_67_19]|nr:MAG: hypothetical protein A3H34_01905 [Betaproteobacteria bacterium RIFCSPLOWO2_02_FULL_67_19]
MKRTALRTRKVRVLPRNLRNARLKSDFADSFEDRIGDNLFDYDDERETLEVVVQRVIRSVN